MTLEIVESVNTNSAALLPFYIPFKKIVGEKTNRWVVSKQLKKFALRPSTLEVLHQRIELHGTRE